MKKIVFDSFAVLTWLQREREFERVVDYLTQASAGKAKVYLSSVNLGEVYYVTARKMGTARAETALAVINNSPIRVVPATWEVCFEAAKLKISRRIACAACFCAAVAKIEKCPVLTGDPEFKLFGSEVAIDWLDNCNVEIQAA